MPEFRKFCGSAGNTMPMTKGAKISPTDTQRGMDGVRLKRPPGLSARLRVLAALLRDTPLPVRSSGRLLWRNDHRRVMSLVLPERLVIGRGEDCELTLANPRISRRHCEIFRCRNTFWIVDLGSTNGTMLNGRRLSDAAVLREGDLLHLGGELLAYVS